MTFTAEIRTRHGVLYLVAGEGALQVVSLGDAARRRLVGHLPHCRLRLRVIYPNGTAMGRGDLAAAIRTVRVLSGEISRTFEAAGGGAAGGAAAPAAPAGGFTCLVTRKVSLNSGKNRLMETA